MAMNLFISLMKIVGNHHYRQSCLLVCLIFPPLLLATENDRKDAIPNSRYWPFRVELTQPFVRNDRPASPLPEGMTGVLIRAQSDGLIVDFGRFGLYSVSPEITDFQNRVHEIQAGILEKSDPNYVNMIGPRLIQPGKDAPAKFPLARTRAAKAFLFVYVTDRDSLASLEAEFASVSKDLENVVAILIPQFPYTDLEINSLLNRHNLPCKAFLDFLCQPYIHSLHHSPEGKNRTVLTDMEGKILQETNGIHIQPALEALNSLR